MPTATKRRPPAVLDAVSQYAEDVVAGRIVTGKLVRQACERHLRDLIEGPGRGLRWRPEKGQRVIDFFAQLKLPDGQNAGKTFRLEPWQQFIVGSLFGWLRADGTRRFRYAYIAVARANGKTPLGAGLLLYGLTADGEPSAQCYAAATTRDQAKIAFRDATKLVESNPVLNRSVEKLVNNLSFRGAFLRPLSSDASKMDGLRVHFALEDELHEHPSGDVTDKLRTGMKSSQPMLIQITTAGYSRETVCWQEHEYSCKVLDGIFDDDARFAYIAMLDEEDDWTDETLWIKPNPNLGVTVHMDTLRQECNQAKLIPGQQNPFKRLRGNIWTEQEDRWLDIAAWDRCLVDFTEDDMEGQPCWAGLDLSTVKDLTAFVLVFKVGEKVRILPYFWVPEDNIRQRVEHDRVPYDVWVRDGWIRATPGNVVDYGFVRRDILALAKRFNIVELAKDRWNSTGIGSELMGDGLTVIDYGQGFASMTAPAKEFERLIVSGDLEQNGHPVMRWMVSNVTVLQDPAGNLKPDKAKSGEKIDGVAAALMGIGRAIVTDDGYSVYEGRGLLVL